MIILFICLKPFHAFGILNKIFFQDLRSDFCLLLQPHLLLLSLPLTPITTPPFCQLQTHVYFTVQSIEITLTSSKTYSCLLLPSLCFIPLGYFSSLFPPHVDNFYLYFKVQLIHHLISEHPMAF